MHRQILLEDTKKLCDSSTKGSNCVSEKEMGTEVARGTHAILATLQPTR